jgi:hypothetical protein
MSGPGSSIFIDIWLARLLKQSARRGHSFSADDPAA